MVKAQAHEKFVVFDGAFGADAELQAFCHKHKVQIKSISILEDRITVGYVDGEGYPVRLEEHDLGPGNNLAAFIADAAKVAHGDVICHSLYRRRDGNVGCVFLVHVTK